MTHSGGTSIYGKPDALSKRLRQVLVLQRENATQDAYGESVPSWTTVDFGVRGEVKAKGGSEFTQSGQQIATRSIEVLIRYRSDITITPQHRFTWQGRTFHITGILDPDGMRKILICQCTEDAG